ncbi:SMAD/FHA domain protein [Pseudomonas sp. R1-18]|uniref:SctD/MshK family protein n=1 Tax=Pseudomonas sp. R1-18 TaxID=1632772 RepID=UPI003DA8D2E0
MTALISLKPASHAATGELNCAALEILDGLHKGIALALDKAVYRVGTASDTDLILGDAGVAARHLVLRLAGAQLAIEATGGDVGIMDANGNATLLQQGHGQRVRMPVELRIGEARLRLRGSQPLADHAAASKSSLTPSAPGRRAIVLASLLVLLMLSGALAFGMRTEPQAPTQLHSALHTSPMHTPTVEQARAWLDQSLKDAELSQVQTRAYGGQLTVEGSYPAQLKDRWLEIQQTFDARFGQHVVLTPRVQALAAVAKPRVRFQAVWFGRNPYVIDEHGKRLYPGASLQDNWVLEGIEGGQVRLVRGHERFAFTL